MLPVISANERPVIQFFTHHGRAENTFYAKENVLVFIVQGSMTLRYGKAEHAVCRGQMIFLKKDMVACYKVFGAPETAGAIEFFVFHLQYEVVKEFAKIGRLPGDCRGGVLPVLVVSADGRLMSFVDTLRCCFDAPRQTDAGLFRIKLLELLFYVAEVHGQILAEILDLRDCFRSDIRATVEDNLTNPLSLNELAVLSGRSLSSFRRDFFALYNMTPSKWIREKRLEKARDFLHSTTMTVTDICYTLGFDSIAHFSKVFKSYFGYPPTAFRGRTDTAAKTS